MLIQARFRSCVLVATMADPVELAMIPPESAVPAPVIVSPPKLPVLMSTIPFTGSAPPSLLPEETLWKSKALEPMVVPLTLSAVALGELMVLLLSCTVTVPPPLALNPVPVAVTMSRPLPVLLKATVPEFPVRPMPAPTPGGYRPA